MHILHLIDSLRLGGAERSLAALAPWLVGSGLRLDVAYLHERDGIRDDLLAAGATLHHVPGSNRMAWIREVAKLIRHLGPELVHTTLFESDIVGRAASFATGTTCVSSIVNSAYGPEQFASPGIRRHRLLLAQAADIVTARHPARFHAVSEHVADTMAPRLHIPRSKIDVIPRGRDAERLGVRSPERRSATRRRLGVDDRVPVVLAVGRLEFQKGFDVLLESFAGLSRDLPNLQLLIAGNDGAQTAALRSQARACDDRVHFLGARDDVPDLLCAADVLAFPSRWEGMPGTLIEAMATETPIVASDIPPVREVLGDAVGRLVPGDDSEALRSRLAQTLRAIDTEKTRTDAGRSRFLDHFTMEHSAIALAEFYRRARDE